MSRIRFKFQVQVVKVNETLHYLQLLFHLGLSSSPRIPVQRSQVLNVIFCSTLIFHSHVDMLLFYSILSSLILLSLRCVHCDCRCKPPSARTYGSLQKNGVCFNVGFQTIVQHRVTEHMALIKGGTYHIGTNKPRIPVDGEAPERRIRVESFYMDQFEVSNADFARFVDQNGYQTDAERFGDSFVLYSLIKDAETKEQNVSAVAAVPWWLAIPGASWRHPEGPESFILGYYMH